MAQDYYTLEEAANIVHMAPDDLKALARKGELRSFQDRGTWRFRVQDIDELARRRGQGSDPDLVLGESAGPKPADSPAPRSPAKSREAEVFDFTFDDESVGVGKEFLLDVPGSGRKQDGSKKDGPKSAPKSGPKSPGPKSPGPRSPAPKPGSDSDVRLVAQGSDVDFQLAVDSDAKLVDDSAPPQSKPRGRTGVSGPTSPRPGGQPDSKRRPGTAPPGPPTDSGVRLVPMDSDSDVRIVGPGSDEAELPLGESRPPSHSDSDIRLEQQQQQKPASDESMLTEEINLDEELRQQDAKKPSSQAKIRPKPPSSPTLPSTSPFELSQGELNLPPLDVEPTPQAKANPKDSSSDFELTPNKPGSSGDLEISSSDFDITPAATTSSPVEPPPSSEDEFRLDLPDDEVALGGPASGISLTNPADSGISLEQGGEGSDEIEFELTLDADSTPKPAAAPSPADSDSEFELTLDAEAPSPSSSDSEFELTLDSEEPKPGVADSDSEFELTVDDSGGLSPLETEASPLAKADSGEQDIFETDFEVPALEEESGSEAVALDADTNLDSSDFDLALDEQDAAADEESGSQVVALDEEEAGDAEATVQKPGRKAKAKAKAKKQAAVEEEEEAEAEPFGDLEEEAEVQAEEELEEEAPARTVVKEKLLPPAPWPVWPTVFMLPCVAVMIVVALLGFELVQSMNDYKSPGLITRTLTDMIGGKK
jgi:hypothetical protein